ncbi:MAG: phosphoenolpyruvate--protein phosphotransferase [Parachlamydiaceae bacterium]
MIELEEEIVLEGHPICRGIAIGKPFFLSRADFKIFESRIPAGQIEREIDRYRHALSLSKQDIKRLQKQLEVESAAEGVLILEAQLEMLHDPLLTTEIEKEIKKNKKNAEFVFQRAILKYQERFKCINDPFFSERFQDLQDLSRRIFSYLSQSNNLSLTDLPPNSVVCAHDLTASDTASAQSFCVSAFVTQTGGATSHAAIVAKAKGIPYVANVNLEALNEHPLALIIVDGRSGKVILNPSEETIEEYEQLNDRMQNQFKALKQVTKWPAQTFDGYALRLCANLDVVHEADLVHELGGAGVGLFRSEYIFLPHNEIPSEEEQYLTYRHLIQRMKGLYVVIRTFDIGGDKPLLNPLYSNEKNNFLGYRPTRSLLREKVVLKTQLKAILRASFGENVGILFPMISTLSELLEAKRILQEAREELRLFHPIRIGCMIEVPSAALIVDHFAQECDFFSIGTNDLVQYAFAIDRCEHSLHEFHEPADPSIIRLMKLIISEANKARIPVSVCGEIASDPRFTALLLGLGVQELSVAPRYLPIIKNTIRGTSIVHAVDLAERALALTTAQEIHDMLVDDYRKNFPDDLFFK